MPDDRYARVPDGWIAQWLTLPVDGQSNNMFWRVRATMHLEGPASDAHVYVSAHSSYRLWINGRLVGEGPMRDDPAWYHYDSYDVSDCLHPGENVLAALVQNGQPPHAFLCQLEWHAGGKWERIGTGPDWCVERAAEYADDTIPFSFAEYSERFDARREPAGWRTPGFDACWAKAQVLGPVQTAGTCRRSPSTPPFAVVLPRDIPQPGHRLVRPTAIVDCGEALAWISPGSKDLAADMAAEVHQPLAHCSVTGLQSLVAGSHEQCLVSGPLLTAGVEDFQGIYEPYIVLDFGELVNAQLELEVEGPSGAVIDVGFADRMHGGRIVVHAYHGYSQVDRVIQGPDVTRWLSFHWHQFRYVQLSFRDLAAPIRLRRVIARTWDYPFASRGRFRCSEKELNQLWDMTERTVRLGAYDNFIDNGLREKTPWTGDISVIALGAFALFGDDPIIRRYFRSNIQGQARTGLLPPHWPAMSLTAKTWGPNGEVLWFEHPMLLVLRIAEYGTYGGHHEFIAECAPAICRYVEALNGYLNMDGLLEDAPGFHWVDWAPVNLKGAPFLTNLWFAQILTFASGLPGTSDGWRQRRIDQAKEILVKLRTAYWVEERRLFADNLVAGQPSRSFSEHSNYSALQYGLASEEQAKHLWAALADSEAEDLVRVEPSFMYPAVSAMLHGGQRERALAFIRVRYRRWLEAGYSTLPEEWHPYASRRGGRWMPRIRALAQGASCGLPFAFLEGWLGVQATAPGYRQFVVEPAIDVLDWAEGVVPAPCGDIAVSWQREGEAVDLNITCPDGAQGTVVLPDHGHVVESHGLAMSGPDARRFLLVPGRNHLRLADAEQTEGDHA